MNVPVEKADQRRNDDGTHHAEVGVDQQRHEHRPEREGDRIIEVERIAEEVDGNAIAENVGQGSQDAGDAEPPTIIRMIRTVWPRILRWRVW